MLIVPQACGQTSWAEWRRDQGDQGGPEIDGALPVSFRLENEGYLFARAVLDPVAANDWLERALAGASGGGERGAFSTTLPAVDPVPALAVELAAPDALVRVLPGTDAPAGVLLAGLKRPAQALLWRCPNEEPFPEPARVELGGRTIFLPALDLAGIHLIPQGGVSARTTPSGLLVGRAERRAWIRGARGSGDFDSFLAELGWEPERIDLADLELTHEEFFDDELVGSVRIRLEDLDTSAVEDRGRCQVTLPTLGRKVAHGLALHTLEGELLDRSGPYPIVERIEMSLEVNGHKLPPIVTGMTNPPPGLEERLDRRERIAEDIEQVIQSGVQARMIADRQTALARLRDSSAALGASYSCWTATSGRMSTTGGCWTTFPSLSVSSPGRSPGTGRPGSPHTWRPASGARRRCTSGSMSGRGAGCPLGAHRRRSARARCGSLASRGPSSRPGARSSKRCGTPASTRPCRGRPARGA
jgi:hypothetical protein